RFSRDWSSDVCSSDLGDVVRRGAEAAQEAALRVGGGRAIEIAVELAQAGQVLEQDAARAGRGGGGEGALGGAARRDHRAQVAARSAERRVGQEGMSTR